MVKKKHNCKSIEKKAAAILVLAVVLAGTTATVWKIRSTAAERGIDTENLTQTMARAPSISAGAAILINAEDGKVLYEYNADEKMYPASTTKIMTALVVLDICDDLKIGLDSEIVVPAEAQGVEGSSVYLKAGERLCLEELMYGLMLQSGNDAAVALAACMGGTQAAFVERMNEMAAELGCKGTHFVNPNGLYDEEHYTTARDLAVIAREALRSEEFCRIVSTEQWSNASLLSAAKTESEAKEEAPQQPGAEASDASGDEKSTSAAVPRTERTFVNKNKTVFQYEGGDGVKIGYTKASGRTLVASASRGGVQLIAVVLNDGNWFNDAYGLMDYGFEVLGVSADTGDEEANE